MTGGLMDGFAVKESGNLPNGSSPILAVFELYPEVNIYDWCLTPTLAVFELYLGVNIFYIIIYKKKFS
jgi:antibiotic biosynthesis monooxygenase (ABM) superfamily enzyme